MRACFDACARRCSPSVEAFAVPGLGTSSSSSASAQGLGNSSSLHSTPDNEPLNSRKRKHDDVSEQCKDTGQADCVNGPDLPIDPEAECGICLASGEELTDVLACPCPGRHVFCKACLRNWVRRRRICPVCRQSGGALGPFFRHLVQPTEEELRQPDALNWLSDAFRGAAKHGEVETMVEIRQLGGPMEEMDEDAITPLIYWAASEGHEAVVRWFCEAGADVSLATETGETAIHSACWNGHEAIAEALLKHGADACAVEEDGWTPLHSACTEGHVAIIEMLLACGADVNAELKTDEFGCEVGDDFRSEVGDTPLHAAAGGCHVQATELLLQQNANIFAKNSDGWTPLHTACAHGGEAIAKSLIEHQASPCWQDETGETPLHIAIIYGHAEVVSVLFAAASESSIRTAIFAVDKTHNWNPLHVAAVSDQPGIAVRLMEMRAPIDGSDVHGFSPLHLAAADGHVQVVSKLLTHSANPNIKSTSHFEGIAPVSYALRNLEESNSTSVVECLRQILNAKAEINNTYRELHDASEKNVDAVRLLLAYGAHVDAEDITGRTPLHCVSWSLAMEHNEQIAVVDNLLKAHASPNGGSSKYWSPLQSFTWNRNLEAASLLIRYRADIDDGAFQLDGMTSLHIGCRRGWSDLVALLLNAGVSVNVVTIDGWTPLHEAAWHGHVVSAALLLRHGTIKIEATSSDGWTSAHKAGWNNHGVVIALLARHDADLDAKTPGGHTPLDIASWRGSADAVNTLASISALRVSILH